MAPPETCYAKSGDVRFAYQVTGNGPFDLVFIPGFVSNLDLWWENPVWVRFFVRFAAFSRLILFDNGAPASQTALAVHRIWRHGWMTCAP